MTTIAHSTVASVVAVMWNEVLMMPAALVCADDLPTEPGRAAAVATVTITGPAVTVVEVVCSAGLATNVAERVFGTASPTVEAEIADVVKELANVVGGSVKSVLPGPAVMSIPTFALIDRSHPGAPAATPTRQSWHWTTSSGGHLSVTVVGGDGRTQLPGAHR